jgi:hypothetical protein
MMLNSKNVLSSTWLLLLPWAERVTLLEGKAKEIDPQLKVVSSS